MTVRRTRNEIGAMGEALAVLELEEQGLEILDRNWSCRWGELDVVALERSEGRRTAVFCEVKCRTGRCILDPADLPGRPHSGAQHVPARQRVLLLGHSPVPPVQLRSAGHVRGDLRGVQRDQL